MNGVQLDLLDGRRKRRNRPVVAPEAKEQEALMAWARLSEARYPELKLLHHIPNGGFRHYATAVSMRRQGVRRGVPDLSLPVARGGYHGLYVELKRKGGKLTDEQAEWIDALCESGYQASVCYGWEHARQTIEEYLNA